MSNSRPGSPWTSALAQPESETSTAIPRRPGKVARTFLTAGLVLALIQAPEAGTNLRWKRETFASESSTSENEVDENLLLEIKKLFDQGSEELFIDGYSSSFSTKLITLVQQHGREAVRAITKHILSGFAKPDVVSEALRWLADFNDTSTLSHRWYLLERTLRNPSPRVRDGAILGFATLDDPRAIPYLDEARVKENVVELQKLIDKVRKQLTR